jgi:Ca2+-binding EF-hand superfamily protein
LCVEISFWLNCCKQAHISDSMYLFAARCFGACALFAFAPLRGAGAASSKEVAKHIVNDFMRWDADNSGFLEAHEMTKLLRGSGHSAEEVLRDNDVDHDGKLTYAEVVALAKKAQAIALVGMQQPAVQDSQSFDDETTSKEFLKLDRDHSGYLEEREIRNGLEGSLHSVADLLRDFDHDGDGRLSHREVQSIAKQSTGQQQSLSQERVIDQEHQSLSADADLEFSRLDRDHSGYLEAREIGDGLTGTSHPITDVLYNYDIDNDGRLSHSEVQALARQSTGQPEQPNSEPPGGRLSAFMARQPPPPAPPGPQILPESSVGLLASIGRQVTRLAKQPSGTVPSVAREDGQSMVQDSKSMKDEVDTEFSKLDLDHSGYLEEHEINAGLAGSEFDSARVLLSYDLDRDGRLSNQEVLNMATQSGAAPALADHGDSIVQESSSLEDDATGEFQRLDRDHSGYLETNEISSGLSGSGPNVGKVLETYDQDQDGKLSHAEVLSIARKASQVREQPASMTQSTTSLVDEAGGEFHRLDRDGSGYLEANEIIPGLTGSGHSVTEVLKDFDRDFDGRLSYNEVIEIGNRAAHNAK